MPLEYAAGRTTEGDRGDLLVLAAVFGVCMVFAVRYFRWEEAPKCDGLAQGRRYGWEEAPK